jgi:hypothetical protein
MFSGLWVTDRKQRLTRNFDSPSSAAGFSPQPEPRTDPHIESKKRRRVEANLLPFDFVLDFWTCYLGSMRTVSRDCRSSSQADVLRRAAARFQLQHKQEEDEWERTRPPDVRVIWGISRPRQRMENEVRRTRNGNQIIEEIFPAPLYPGENLGSAPLNRRISVWRKLCDS